MHLERKTVGIIDSGVGGLTISAGIQSELPFLSQVVVYDNGCAPYGNRSATQITNRMIQLTRRLVDEFAIELLILACNTASTVALPALRKHFPKILVVGVVPAVKPAALSTQSSTLAVLATPVTASGSYLEKLIAEHCNSLLVRCHSAIELVEEAEMKFRGQNPDSQKIRAVIEPLLQDARIDTIVLGCTHFSYLITEMTQIAERPIKWIDSRMAIAKRVAELLPQHQTTQQKQIQLLTTSELQIPSQSLQEFNISEIKLWKSNTKKLP